MARAFEQVWKNITGVPAVDLRGKRYTFVSYTAAGDLKVNTPAAGENVVGVLYEDYDKDQPVQIVAQGFAFIKLGGTVKAGEEVQTDAEGRAVKLDTGKSAGTCVIGGVADDIGTVLIK